LCIFPFIAAATMQKELENLNIRVFYFLNCKEDVESDVKVMRRATLKTRKNLEKSELAKKEQACMNETTRCH